jgi:hypothetical protein
MLKSETIYDLKRNECHIWAPLSVYFQFHRCWCLCCITTPACLCDAGTWDLGDGWLRQTDVAAADAELMMSSGSRWQRPSGLHTYPPVRCPWSTYCTQRRRSRYLRRLIGLCRHRVECASPPRPHHCTSHEKCRWRWWTPKFLPPAISAVVYKLIFLTWLVNSDNFLIIYGIGTVRGNCSFGNLNVRLLNFATSNVVFVKVSLGNPCP